MPRPCSICTHPKRKDIDKAIARGVSYRAIAGQYQVSKTSVSRHFDSGHVSSKVQKAKELKADEEALSFLDYVTELNEKDRESFKKTMEKGTSKERADATRTRINALTFVGKATGEYIEKREITGRDGGPIEILSLTDDELEQEIRDVLTRVKGTPQ